MKVGFHSPMPPSETGVADYSAALYQALRELGDVELGAERADVQLYHLGNNHLHRAIYERALREPGVAVIHDAVLHHFFLGSLSEQLYVDEFVYNYGAWTADLARQLWAGRARSSTDPRFFEYPMLKRISERSRAVIVHNPAAETLIRKHVPAARVYEIPHLFVRPEMPAGFDVERLRARLGLDGSTFLFGVFGHLRESKRLFEILRAFDAVKGGVRIALLIAGEFASSDLRRAIEPLLEDAGIHRVGHMPEKEFWLYASAADACINLRYPGAGETSGIAIRLMGIGKPVLLSAGDEVSRFPEASCVRIDTGITEDSMLRTSMCWLAENRGDARAIGARARDFIEEQHAIKRVAEAYLRALNESVM